MGEESRRAHVGNVKVRIEVVRSTLLLLEGRSHCVIALMGTLFKFQGILDPHVLSLLQATATSINRIPSFRSSQSFANESRHSSTVGRNQD